MPNGPHFGRDRSRLSQELATCILRKSVHTKETHSGVTPPSEIRLSTFPIFRLDSLENILSVGDSLQNLKTLRLWRLLEPLFNRGRQSIPFADDEQLASFQLLW